MRKGLIGLVLAGWCLALTGCGDAEPSAPKGPSGEPFAAPGAPVGDESKPARKGR